MIADEGMLTIQGNKFEDPARTLGSMIRSTLGLVFANNDGIIMAPPPTLTREYDKLATSLQVIQEVTMKAFDEFVEMIREIPSVETVEAWVPGTFVKITINLSESDRGEREQIYAAERELRSRYQDQLVFDFDWHDRRGEPKEQEERPARRQVGPVTEYSVKVRQLPNRDDHNDAEE